MSISLKTRQATLLFFVGLLAISPLAEPVFGQRRRTSRRPTSTIFTQLKYDRSKRIATELGLTDELREKILKLEGQTKMSSEVSDAFKKKYSAAKTSEEKAKVSTEWKAAGAKAQTDAEAMAMKLLSEKQRVRLGQLKWRMNRARSGTILTDEVVKILSITDDQKTQIKKILDQRSTAAIKQKLSGSSPPEEIAKFKAEWDPKTFAPLKPAQRTQWMAMIGPPLKLIAKAGSTTSKSSPSSTAGTPSATLKRAPEPKIFIASFDATAEAARKKAASTYGTSANTTRQPMKSTAVTTEKRTMSFTFKNAPWRVVLEFFAKKTGLSLDQSESPPDTFTYSDPNLYTPTQALDVLNGYLLQKNFILVRRDRALVVHNLANEVPVSLIPDVKPEDLPSRGRNELMRVTYLLKEGADIVEVAKEVEEINEATYSKIITFTTANRLVITDIGTNLLRINRILEDVTEKTEDSDLTFRSFELKHIRATDAAKLVSEQLGATTGARNVSGRDSTSSRSSSSTDRRAQFMQMMQQRRGGSSGSSRGGSTQPSSSSRTSRTSTGGPKVTANSRTNSLLVTAPLSQIKIVEKLIEAIDVPVTGDNPLANQVYDDTPYFKVYKVYRADVMEVTKTLNALVPDIVINEDGRNGLIHIMGSKDEHTYMVELLSELDGGGEGGQTLDVIHLRRLDPVAVANTLTAMFTEERGSAPNIQADVQGRQLLIKGSTSQITQIRSFVEKLEGKGAGTLADLSGQGGNIRVLPIPGDSTQFLRTLQQMWSGANPEIPIRIVVPSDPEPVRNRLTPSGNDAGSKRQPSRGFQPPEETKKTRTTTDYRVTPLNRRGNLPLVATSYRNESPRRNDVTALIDQPEVTALQKKPAAETAKAKSSKKEPANNPASLQKTAPPAKKITKPSGSSVSIMVQDGQLVITSNDTAALDRMQLLIESLNRAIPVKTTWTVFYLRSADATQTATMLEQIFPSSTVSSTSTGGGLMGGLTSGLSSIGNNLMNASGLSSLGQTADELRIVPDVRSNSLFVTGTASKIRDVERVLKILDEDKLPASLRDRSPKMIPVNYANVTEVYQNVAELYKDYMQPTRSSAGGANALAALMGGGNKRGGSRGQQAQQQVRLTLSVDERTGQLLVSASEALYTQIEQLVYQLDKTAYEARYTTRVIQLENARASEISQTLTTMFPTVSVSGTSTTRRPTQSQGSNSQQSQSDQMRNAMRSQFMQRMMGGQGEQPRSGSTPGGNRGGSRGNPSSGGRSRSGGFNPGGGSQGGFRPSSGGRSRGGRGG